jgi:hypothetical protein
MARKRRRDSLAEDGDGACSHSDSEEEMGVGHSSLRSSSSNGTAGEDSDKDDAACGAGVDMVDPLALIENGLFRVADDYEALANKKRKALQVHPHSSG